MAGLSAYAKGVSLGIIEPSPELVRERGQRLAEGEQLRVDLLGRAVPVVQTPDGLRAVSKGNAGSVEKYLVSKFGAHLEVARAAMQELAAAYEATELQRRGFRLYERFDRRFRPASPAGAPSASWTSKGSGRLLKCASLGPRQRH